VTQAEYIAKIMPHVPHGCCASDEALSLVSEAISALPDCAELWLLHGWVTMAAAECDVSDAAGRSFEMAIKIDPALSEAQVGLDRYRNVAHRAGPGQP